MASKKKPVRVPFSYLQDQFKNLDPFLEDIRRLVKSTDFTLGRELERFESEFAQCCAVPYAVGVNSGTDAIFLSLKALNIRTGDEVITTPMTFYATIGALRMAGAVPRFVDSNDQFLLDVSKIRKCITAKTRAILPVHYYGNICDMDELQKISKEYSIPIIEDACQAFGSLYREKPAGSFGTTGCFSLHPLKNINVWGDAGMIVTRSKKIYKQLLLLRNHGLVHRDRCLSFGYNSRMDTLQAVIGNRIIKKLPGILRQRARLSSFYDRELSNLSPHITIPPRNPLVRHSFHLYVVRARKRNQLLEFLNENGVEAKVHYPIPIHLQPAARTLSYSKGDFPVCEKDCRRIITLPCHQHLALEQAEYVVRCIRQFYEQ